MASLEFVPYPIGYDSAGVMKEIDSIVNIKLDEFARTMIRVLGNAIYSAGNGSTRMKTDAVKQVKELSRSGGGGIYEMEVGIDEGAISDDIARIRTIVVLHGNLHSGPLRTKPGEDTWDKHISSQSESGAATIYLLPGGMWQHERTDKILDAYDKEIEKYVKVLAHDLEILLMSIDYSKYWL